MAIYRYVKRLPGREFSKGKPGKFNSKIFSSFLIVLGIFCFANAAYPIASYQLLVSPRFSSSFVSPASESTTPSFGSPVQVLGSEVDLIDLTEASNWFPASDVTFEENTQQPYTLSIPKLGIFDAQVKVGGEDLKKNLIQYPGTAVPGRYGNTVIFGHSVLPQFFNPKNYMTIFSTLPTLRIKDEIWVNYPELRFRYLIEQMIEVTPNDISILAQRYDDSYLTLITCVPPGTYLKRLIVRARLTKI